MAPARGARQALAFLTRLPGGAHPADATELAGAVPWFPVVGVLVGALVGALDAALAQVLPPLTAATLAMGFSALVTGGFHEDGFADSLDALSGGRDVAHRLEILKDSRHGTFGVLGLVVLTLVKVSALAELSGWQVVAALVAAGALGRAGAVGVMGVVPAATGTGLGASYLQGLSSQQVALGLGLGLIAGTLALGPVVLPAVAVVAAGSVLVSWWARRRIGGISGDLLGAVEQVGECGVLVLLAALAPGHLRFT